MAYPYPYPSAALGYRQPIAIPRPAGVTTLAIIGIVVAAFSLLAGLSGLLTLTMFSFVSSTMMPNFGGYRLVMIWNGVSGIITGLIGALLLVASIGCLGMSPWGRRAMVWYALAALAWIAIKLVITLVWVVPAEEAFMNSVMSATPATTAMTTAPVLPPAPTTVPTSTTVPTATRPVGTATVQFVTKPTLTAAFSTGLSGLSFNTATFRIAYAVGWAMISAVYPAIVLIYMTRRRTKGAFTPTADDHRPA